MMRFNFGRKARRVARRQYRRGLLNYEDYQKVVNASRDPEIVAQWQEEVEAIVPGAPWKGEKAVYGFDFSSIWDWFIENWPKILEVLMLLLTFLGTNPSESEDENGSDEGGN